MKTLISLITLFAFYSCKCQNVNLKTTEKGVEVGTKVNDKKQGYWCFYNKSDKLFKLCFYNDDIIDGKCIKFYSDGKIETIINFYKGRINGEVEFYSTKGVLLATYIYSNDIIKEIKYYVIDNESPPRNHDFIPTY
ncbi:toxin-antitoxin system YwqK family antitoxin [Flavobacterium branchiophilum]|uniref:MORN repeat protein n=1 Tax=Flavobacterium branchiophilum TaxID=55197 RepID=A0A2H3KQK8_9FLAO|nr:hypothetical protein [Flavobacterium branchiophilum]PDS24021.1 hypothetical protein B0A77_09365 [Flavobacterium branchiophilum]